MNPKRYFRWYLSHLLATWSKEGCHKSGKLVRFDDTTLPDGPYHEVPNV